MCACGDPESLVRGGTTLTKLFFCFLMRGELIGGGRADPNTALGGPSSARQQNAIETAFCSRADVGPTSNAGFAFQGIQTSIRKPYNLVVFQGGGTKCPHLSRHMDCLCERTTRNTQS